MEEYLSWISEQGGQVPTDGPTAIAKFIAEHAEDGNLDPFREYITNVALHGACWQGRERNVGIDGAGYTEVTLDEGNTEDWAVEVWNTLQDGLWHDDFNEHVLDKVNT